MLSLSVEGLGGWLALSGFLNLLTSTILRIPTHTFSKENIYVLEKAREIGQHCLSGALLDPRSMRELLPGFEKEAPLDARSHKGIGLLSD